MIYQWKLEATKPQPGGGSLLVYSALADGIPAKALIQSHPQLPNSGFERLLNVTLFLEANKPAITDGLFHQFHFDIQDLIKANAAELFPKPAKPLEYFMTKVLLFENLPDFEVLTNGDWGIPKDSATS